MVGVSGSTWAFPSRFSPHLTLNSCHCVLDGHTVNCESRIVSLVFSLYPVRWTMWNPWGDNLLSSIYLRFPTCDQFTIYMYRYYSCGSLCTIDFNTLGAYDICMYISTYWCKPLSLAMWQWSFGENLLHSGQCIDIPHFADTVKWHIRLELHVQPLPIWHSLVYHIHTIH